MIYERDSGITIIADLDGTILQRWSREDYSPRLNLAIPACAIVTNQGGVALRLVHLPDGGKYPPLKTVLQRIRAGMQFANAAIAIATLYHPAQMKREFGRWLADVGSRQPPLRIEDNIWVSFSPKFRKPEPGALLWAADKLGVLPEHCCYVGDEDTDQKAALAAGMSFIWGQELESRQDLSLAR